MKTILGTEKPHPEALAQMCERGGTWFAYQNIDMSSAALGHLQFLKCGEGCTYVTPPERYPADTQAGMGWRYVLCGQVILTTGEIE